MATEIQVDVKLNIKASLVDCIKMRILGFKKDAESIIEYLEKHRIGVHGNCLPKISDRVFTTESIVNELSKREGVEEFWVLPYKQYTLEIEDKNTVGTGPVRILVVTD